MDLRHGEQFIPYCAMEVVPCAKNQLIIPSISAPGGVETTAGSGNWRLSTHQVFQCFGVFVKQDQHTY